MSGCVLGFCPTYRVEPETREALIAQQWAGGYDVVFTRDNPYPHDDAGRANILHNYRKARQACLGGGYDALWVVESDIIPPLDALKKLNALGADVAYGAYLFRSWGAAGGPVINVCRHVVAPAPDQSLSFYPDEYRAAWGKVIRCSGSGTGCILIRRRALEAIDFRPCQAHCDSAFTEDVFKAGLRMMADMTVVCGHKAPDGQITWPLDEPLKMRISHGVTGGYRGELADDPTHQPTGG